MVFDSIKGNKLAIKKRSRYLKFLEDIVEWHDHEKTSDDELSDLSNTEKDESSVNEIDQSDKNLTRRP